MANHHDRYPDNVPGSYYVDDQCIDCDLCRERIPDIFVRNSDAGHSYVRRQPVGAAEIAICEEALESCPIEAIGNDGMFAADEVFVGGRLPRVKRFVAGVTDPGVGGPR